VFTLVTGAVFVLNIAGCSGSASSSNEKTGNNADTVRAAAGTPVPSGDLLCPGQVEVSKKERILSRGGVIVMDAAANGNPPGPGHMLIVPEGSFAGATDVTLVLSKDQLRFKIIAAKEPEAGAVFTVVALLHGCASNTPYERQLHAVLDGNNLEGGSYDASKSNLGLAIVFNVPGTAVANKIGPFVESGWVIIGD
jgi:hypothetical protein